MTPLEACRLLVRMTPTDLRPPAAPDEASILALNEGSVRETSPLDSAGLRALLGTCFRARVHETSQEIDAFMIALDETARSPSPNFAWFRRRHARFVYVDRVVVAERARGRGLARALYADARLAAERAGHGLICCEVNVDPPNPASDVLHERLGFEEVGRAILGPQKTVRYMVKRLGSP